MDCKQPAASLKLLKSVSLIWDMTTVVTRFADIEHWKIVSRDIGAIEVIALMCDRPDS